MALIEIPARRGKAAFVAAGQTVTVINTHGEQVVDTWAFNRADLGEFMSNEHTRAHNLRLVPKPGDVLRSNRRRPILTLTEDTSGDQGMFMKRLSGLGTPVGVRPSAPSAANRLSVQLS